jgi:RHS repeat-associated protein
VTDQRTDASGVSTTYDYTYTDNGAIASMLARPAPSPSGSPGKGKGKTGEPSETNVWDRTFTWNQLDQLTSADDGSALRTFAYDDVGNLTIKDGNLLADDGTVIANHGGGPETIFLNRWVTIRAQKIYKHVWAGDDRLLVQMDSDGYYESKQLFGHEDLVGSTNIVTDVQGRGFQRHEYFPSGEIWIDDHKEQIRTPFQFAGGYYEDEFDLVLFGTRWYDTERELFLSPDPVLVDDVGALVDQPALGGAYTYAGANGVGNVDPSGRSFFSGHRRAEMVRRDESALQASILSMQQAGEDDQAQAAMDKRERRTKAQERAKLLEPNALLIVDLQKQEVSIGAPYGPRKTWPIGTSSGAAGDGASRPTPGDATRGDGGPTAGDDGALPGSSSIDTSGQRSGGAVPDQSPDDSGSIADSGVQRDTGGSDTASRLDE